MRPASRASRPPSTPAFIAAAMRTLGATRFDMKYSNGTLPHDELMLSIERYATQVVPRVRELLALADGADVGVDAAAASS